MAEINTNETVSEATEVTTEVADTPVENVPTPAKKSADKKPAKNGKKAKKPNFFVRIGLFFARLGKRIAKFFREYNSERKKVSWKPVREVFKSLGVVVVTVAIFSLAIYGIDIVFGTFVEWLPEIIGRLAK